MSGGWGASAGLNFYANDSFGGIAGTTITPSNTTLTKGSFISMGTLTEGCAGFLLGLIYQNNGQADYACQVDIAIGPSGSQVVILANINMAAQPAGIDSANAFQQFIPIGIPPGTQMWARSAVRVANFTGTIKCWIVPLDNTFTVGADFQGIDTIGNTSTGQGTTITGGANAKGTYVSLVASTAHDYSGLFFCFDLAHNATNESGSIIDIALGASGQQKIILPDLFIYNGGVETPVAFEFYPYQIPEGSQIWVRAANVAPATTFGITIYGVYQ